MRSQPYGIAKQLYRTSYSPSQQNTRPSSLNNTNIYSHNHIPQAPLIRIEHNNSSSQAWESQKMCLSGVQSSLQEVNNKMPINDYYPEVKRDDLIKGIQQKL
jgi:hypothetical protein